MSPVFLRFAHGVYTTLMLFILQPVIETHYISNVCDARSFPQLNDVAKKPNTHTHTLPQCKKKVKCLPWMLLFFTSCAQSTKTSFGISSMVVPLKYRYRQFVTPFVSIQGPKSLTRITWLIWKHLIFIFTQLWLNCTYLGHPEIHMSRWQLVNVKPVIYPRCIHS